MTGYNSETSNEPFFLSFWDGTQHNKFYAVSCRPRNLVRTQDFELSASCVADTTKILQARARATENDPLAIDASETLELSAPHARNFGLNRDSQQPNKHFCIRADCDKSQDASMVPFRCTCMSLHMRQTFRHRLKPTRPSTRASHNQGKRQSATGT
jgi:hypothetical protein